MKKTEKLVRRGGVIVMELLALGTLVMLLVTKQYSRLPLAIATPFMILLPEFFEKVFRCKISLPVYLFGLLYAVGPMLGQCHNLYYLVSWWDKALHISGGIMFAILGFYLFEAMGGDRKRILLCAVFALCFSMAVSALWEFVEFGSDRIFGTDMQDDSIVTELNSYLLDEGVGVAGSIENIHAVVIDGTPLPVSGYIDIGLLDTMWDMILESLGALIVCLMYLIDKGKHPLIRPRTETAGG